VRRLFCYTRLLGTAAIGSLTLSVLTPQATLAAPGITLKSSFTGNNGATPYYAALTPAGNGLFYGTTREGGANGFGSIFSFDSVSGFITLKGSFDDIGNGSYPQSALTPSGNGSFYGTAYGGGANNYGSIFEFNPTGSSITLKGSFDGANGAGPLAALTPSGNGTTFYGTTPFGGVNSYGSIFEFDPSGIGSITLKGSFNGANGDFPAAALTPSGNGTTFFGTTLLGGDYNLGTIFEFNPTGSSITLKGSFDGANGDSPLAALTPSGNGTTFFGTTLFGGDNGHGSIFEFDPSGIGSITLKGSFDGANGDGPAAGLTPSGNGTSFYGTTELGGDYDLGTIYEFDPSSLVSIILKGSFDGANGDGPVAALTPAGNGLFYGTASYGGDNDLGTIFEFSDFDPAPGTPVPGPLSLLGVGAAFGWSRRLRRRIQPVRPVFSICR